MSNELANIMTAKALFAKDEVKKKFNELLGKNSASFITSVLQIVAQNKELAKADPTTVYHSAAVAATLGLPLNSNLGFAYIIPYNIKDGKNEDGTDKWKVAAQFQMGYKGFIQLSQRSGQFLTINTTDVREGELKTRDRLTGVIEFAWLENDNERNAKPVVGFVSYFKLLNGFEKTVYMSIAELKQHGGKYSKTFNNKFGLWNTDFNSMATKTVTKMMLSKYAPLSIEMQKAIITDQGVINDEEGTDITYADNIDEDLQIWKDLLSECKDIEDLDNIEKSNKEQIEGNPAILALFNSRRNALTNPTAKERGAQLNKQTELLMGAKNK